LISGHRVLIVVPEVLNEIEMLVREKLAEPLRHVLFRPPAISVAFQELLLVPLVPHVEGDGDHVAELHRGPEEVNGLDRVRAAP
jgi:hypothetical protein